MFNIPPPPFVDSPFDLATFCLIIGIILLSLLSIGFVFYLHCKSRNSYYLQSFNALWTARLLLVLFIILWALNELLRLPFYRQQYLYPFLPPLTLTQQANLCKIHVVLSIGLFEPGFLLILLFLVNVSAKKKTPHGSWAFVFILATCSPILFLHVLFVFFFSRLELELPEIFRRSYVINKSNFGEETVWCAYPLMNSITFGAFGIWYLAAFTLSCIKVLTLVINKGLRVRICGLAFTIMITLPIEIMSLCLSILWTPEETAHSAFTFFIFVSTIVLAAMGEGTLVIRPIADSLAAERDSCLWSTTCEQLTQSKDDQRQTLDVTIQV